MEQFADGTGGTGSGGPVGDVSNGFPLHQRCRFNLGRLAHVEFHAMDNAPSWRVVPPALALNKLDGRWRGVMCGARSPGLEDQLHSSLPSGVHLEVRQQFVAPDAYLLEADDASWRHIKITLRPDNRDFDPIEITSDDEGDLAVVAELVEVLR